MLQGEVVISDEYPYAHSYSSDVFRGRWKGERVAVKALAVSLADAPGRLNKV